MQQRSRRTPAQQMRVTDEEMLNEGEYDDEVWSVRMPSSARRYQSRPDIRTEMGRRQADVQPVARQRMYAGHIPERVTGIPSRRTATHIPAVQGNRERDFYTGDMAMTPRNTGARLRVQQRRNFHWLVFIGLAMFIMIIGWVALSALGNWWQVTQDDWHYGRPRTFQTDAVVGHNDSQANPSHFIAMNLSRHILIIEIPGGDPSKTKIFTGPILIGPGQDLTPVTLSFKDVNGDKLLDMIVNVQDTHFVFINEKGTFRPSRPG